MSDFFSNTRPGTKKTTGQVSFDLPILYFRDDFFAAFFTADAAKVRDLMPSQRLHPITVSPGRVLVGVGAFNYLETSIGPYGEVGVVVPVIHARRAPPPLIPALLESRYPGFGNLVLHLPVTQQIARDAGRSEWGYTKFVADMRFANTPEHQECELREGGRHILTLRVAKSGIPTKDSRPLVTYSVHRGDLLRTVIPQQGIACNALRPQGCFLELGSHEVAVGLRGLRISERPVLSRYYVERSGILPAGKVVEHGVQPLDGYFGKELSASQVAYH